MRCDNAAQLQSYLSKEKTLYEFLTELWSTWSRLFFLRSD